MRGDARQLANAKRRVVGGGPVAQDFAKQRRFHDAHVLGKKSNEVMIDSVQVSRRQHHCLGNRLAAQDMLLDEAIQFAGSMAYPVDGYARIS